MNNNIFMEDRSPISFEEYLQFNENGRGNLGDMLPVTIYRMLEYSIKEELVNNFGKEKQIEIFRKAGRKSGEYFATVQDFRFLARLYVIMMKDLFPEFYLYIQISHMKPLK